MKTKLSESEEILKIIFKKDSVEEFKSYLSNFDFSSQSKSGQNIVLFSVEAYMNYVPKNCCIYLFQLDETKHLLNEVDQYGNNIIYQLFFNECYDSDLVRVCLEKGCDINQLKKITEESLLHYIVLRNDEAVFNLAIEYGANFNAVDKNNHTLLHYVAAHGKNDYICQKVIEKVSDELIFIKDDSSYTAIDLVRQRLNRIEDYEHNYKILAENILEKLQIKYE